MSNGKETDMHNHRSRIHGKRQATYAKTLIGVSLLFATLLLSGCGMHYTVKGQVVDAVTKQPVQGAVVAVHWYRIQWAHALVPLTSGHETVADVDDITDANGMFSIPRYHHVTGDHRMGVYKEGYVCWNNEKIFNPEGKTREEMFVTRKDPGVYEGMIIELVPIDWKGFPAYEHARFVSRVDTKLCSLKFSESTLKERDFGTKEYRKRIGVDK